MHVLSQKQNEMFALATKSMISSAFRNESLGLWYDAKSGVLQCIAELKSKVSHLSTTIDLDESSAGASPNIALPIFRDAKTSVEAK